MSYSEFGELIMKLSRAALRPLLAAHEHGALPMVGAAWGVTARKSGHNEVMPVVTLRARWDATLVIVIIIIFIYYFVPLQRRSHVSTVQIKDFLFIRIIL